MRLLLATLLLAPLGQWLALSAEPPPVSFNRNNHERLTFRTQGRDFRLTDVQGKVVKEILA
jgi:hypothetical protein